MFDNVFFEIIQKFTVHLNCSFHSLPKPYFVNDTTQRKHNVSKNKIIL